MNPTDNFSEIKQEILDRARRAETCCHELQKKPHIHGYQHMEDNTRYDTEN